MAKNDKILPLIPLRDVVIFPSMVVPLFVGRQLSVNALDIALEENKEVFLLCQKSMETENPSEDELYTVGVVASVMQVLRLPDGTLKVLVEGLKRAKLKHFIEEDGYAMAEIEDVSVDMPAARADLDELAMLIKSTLVGFDTYIASEKRISPEVMESLSKIVDPDEMADGISSHLHCDIAKKQAILESTDILQRFEMIYAVIARELDLHEVEKKIQSRVKDQVEKNQRQYYLNEKLKAIQNELGDMDGGEGFDDIKKLEKAIKDAKMPKEALDKAEAELNKLKMMPPMSAEATVSRNYLDWLVKVPWSKRSKVSDDLAKAKKILDNDHYGLEEVKERIIEFLAVQKRVKKIKGPIICLVGPPGVGKTSLGRSIAEATGRKFVRVALGGVRDEAEIRGHRRTYIGALPGKIMQKLAKVEVKNPLFMLDEVDKMAMDFRGDPASALLEVLDPEQNMAFGDHYLEVDYDLSDVVFIATANSLNIPGPLLDRMEVIRIPGYTENEKLNIAKKYLLPKQIKAAGLKRNELSVSDMALRHIIRYYTREAGVRSLERELSKLCRKSVKTLLLKKAKKKIAISNRNLSKYLGVAKFRYGTKEEFNQVGQVVGLAWTEVGGDLLSIETQVLAGKGKLNYTGSLGDVMQESIQAAWTVVRSRARSLGLEAEVFQTSDVHVHVPEGATPKDGPSAGCAMVTALVSSLTNIPVKSSVAMTGEITLRGEVLPIGGLKEKLLAALRGGISDVIIPHENARELVDMPKEVLASVNIHPVRWIEQVLDIALERQPVALPDVVTPKSIAPESIKVSQDVSTKVTH